MEKNKFMMIIIIVLLVLMMGTIVAVSLYVMNMVQKQVEEADGSSRDAQTIKKLGPDETTPISLGDPINTNLQPGTDGKARWVRFGVEVRYDNTQGNDSSAMFNLISLNINKLRGVALACAYKKTYDELSHPDGFTILADEIKESLQALLETNLIEEVTIFDQIIQ